MFEDAPPLPGFLAREFPFRRRAFVLKSSQRISFVDEGSGDPLLLVHGNPMWGYLFRRMLPGLLNAGFRVIVPDLLGFGFSDKPSSPADHQLAMHVSSIQELLVDLELSDYFVFGQDWGGPIVAGAASRVGGVRGAVFGNTAIIKPARPFRPKAFHRFSHMPVISDLVFRGLAFPIPVLWQVQGDASSIGVAEMRAYFHPFMMPWNRAGPLGLARMVPNEEAHPSVVELDAIADWWASFEGPINLVWGKQDPILGRGLRRHREAFPQAKVTETEAGHFIQEEIPEELVQALIDVRERSRESAQPPASPRTDQNPSPPRHEEHPRR